MIERSLRDALVVGLDVAGERCFKFSPRFETRLPNNFSDATVEALDHAVGLQVTGWCKSMLDLQATTGGSWTDPLLTAAFAAFVVWAGASAPWWALVAAGGCAASASGSTLGAAVGLVAAGGAMWVGSCTRAYRVGPPHTPLRDHRHPPPARCFRESLSYCGR